MDQAKLEAFMGKLVVDGGAAVSAALALIGDQLGLYKAMHRAGPMAPWEVAQKTGTSERYVREWLQNQAAGGYIDYDPATRKYTLGEEHGTALADESSPFFFAGAWQAVAACHRAVPKVMGHFKDGSGCDWGEHDPILFEGTERFFKPSYLGNLTTAWIPALEGVQAKLERGARVADVGCGFGASTILMARTFPRSQFAGFDSHAPSIDASRERAKKAGVANARFEVARSTDYPACDGGYDLVAHFDCLHDMADPVGAAKHVRETLAQDGTWMIVEPFASDRPEDNLNPVGRIFYGASTMICLGVSLAQGGPALGAQAGEERLADVAKKGGFALFRRATQTPFNLILEAKA